MKLIDREPTPEMPVIEVHQWRTRFDGRWIDSTKEEAYSRISQMNFEGRTLYTFPPDAQAEQASGMRKSKSLAEAIDNEMVVSHLWRSTPGIIQRRL